MVEIERGLERGRQGSLAVQLRDGSSPDAALEAMRAAVARVRSELSFSYVSAAVPLPDGPFFLIDAAKASVPMRRRAVEIVVEECEARQTGGQLATLPDGERVPHAAHDPAVGLFALRPAGESEATTKASMEWLEVAADWVGADVPLAEGEMFAMTVGVANLNAAPSAFRDVARSAVDAGARVVATRGLSRDGWSRTALLWSTVYPRLVLAAVTDVGEFGRCADAEGPALEALLPLAASAAMYAFVTPETCSHEVADAGEFEGALVWSPWAPERRSKPRGDPSLQGRTCDVTVLDAFPAQVLGPGHLSQLLLVDGEVQNLDGGKVLWKLASVQEWLDPERRSDPLTRGQEVLGPCFRTNDQLLAMLKQRRHDLLRRRDE